MDRLFVPLNTQPFLDFKQHGKQFELRSYGRMYTEKHVYCNRKVELRKGYSGESLWGTVGRIITGSLDEILKEIDYKHIIPQARSEAEARKTISRLMGKKDKYLAFEVILRKN